MELYQLRYFVAVADAENLHRAAEKLHVSPPALSKAVKALEADLGQALFRRRGRNIELTPRGRALRDRAIELGDLADSIRAELGATPSKLQLRIAGRDLLLSEFATPLQQKFLHEHSEGTVHYTNVGGNDAASLLDRGNVHIAVTVTKNPGYVAKNLGTTTAVTCVGEGHPLYRRAKAREAIPIDELLRHRFVSPSAPLIGTAKGTVVRTADGWREDVHPRRVGVVTESAMLFARFVESGEFVAYLPDFWAKRLNVQVLNVSGCLFDCAWTVYAQYRRVAGLEWVRRLVAGT